MTNKVMGVGAYQKTKDIKTAVDSDKKGITAPKEKEGVQESIHVSANKFDEANVVYEKSGEFDGLTTYNKRGKALSPKTIEEMKSEAEMRYARMIETIKHMIAKQSENNGGIPKELEALRKLPTDLSENTIKGLDSGTEALDGYWSAEATAERIVDFAKKISGGDTSKYELLKNAIQKGFDQASSYFEKMPDITGKTHKLVMEKLDKWAGKEESE